MKIATAFLLLFIALKMLSGSRVKWSVAERLCLKPHYIMGRILFFF